jgi:hypothetical protein
MDCPQGDEPRLHHLLCPLCSMLDQQPTQVAFPEACMHRNHCIMDCHHSTNNLYCIIPITHRSFFKRLLISSISALCVLLVAAAVAIIPYGTTHPRQQSYHPIHICPLP